MGTLMHKAPEISNGEDFEFMVDVYAFGIVFNATVASQIPYEDRKFRNPYDLAEAVVAGTRPTIAAGISADWGRLIERCWDDDESKQPRFESIVLEISSREFIGFDVNLVPFKLKQETRDAIFYVIDYFINLASNF
jgi:hypothetical protein